MHQKFYWLSCIMSLFLATLFYGNSYAIELDEATLTVPLNQSGKTTIMTPEQIKRGKRLFNNTCSQCHNGGITKTNPNVGLDSEGLGLATPTRDHLEGLIDYMKNPTSYDGAESIAELHPSIKSAEIFPKMRNLTDDDLFTIAGYILVQPKVMLEKWGGGKIYY
uniref:Photosystem II cytochrome c550 n=1 Tax=Balbiania investiens TaxID=111861 RepID=A0A4D6BM54_9FLOR|nr:photosystem II cytochrome c550 [Balbiania investiens]QBX88547.1 photosystem II cytochrome c550 [Balbiania investiens]